MSKNTIGIVFLSGAGLGNKIWSSVTSKITTPYVIVDYTKVRKNPSAGLSEYVKAAYDAAVSIDSQKIIIVAHSIGGVVGIELARKLGDKVGGFLGVCAAVPQPGQNFFSTLPVPQRFIMPIIVRLAGTKVPESTIKNGLGNGLQEADINRIIKSYQPETKKLYFDKTSSTPLPTTDYAYIRTTDDKELGLAAEDAIIASLPSPIVTDIAGGHLSMVSHPQEVIDALKPLIKVQP